MSSRRIQGVRPETRARGGSLPSWRAGASPGQCAGRAVFTATAPLPARPRPIPPLFGGPVSCPHPVPLRPPCSAARPAPHVLEGHVRGHLPAYLFAARALKGEGGVVVGMSEDMLDGGVGGGVSGTPGSADCGQIRSDTGTARAADRHARSKEAAHGHSAKRVRERV